MLAATASVHSVTPIGSPLAMPLPRQTTSATTPSATLASTAPVRNPVCTSSATSSAPTARAPFPQRAQVAGARHAHTRLALDGLDDDGGDLLVDVLERLDVVVRDVDDVGQQGQERLAIARRRR